MPDNYPVHIVPHSLTVIRYYSRCNLIYDEWSLTTGIIVGLAADRIGSRKLITCYFPIAGLFLCRYPQLGYLAFCSVLALAAGYCGYPIEHGSQPLGMKSHERGDYCFCLRTRRVFGAFYSRYDF
jgi:hypothetical protein